MSDTFFLFCSWGLRDGRSFHNNIGNITFERRIRLRRPFSRSRFIFETKGSRESNQFVLCGKKMKLLNCLKCHDIQVLTTLIRRCGCKRSIGIYLPGNQTVALIRGPARCIGFANTLIGRAYNAVGDEIYMVSHSFRRQA